MTCIIDSLGQGEGLDFHPSAGGSRPMTSPPKRLSIFSIDGDFRLSSRAELAFFRERSRGINAKRFLPSRAFSGTSLRVDPSTRSLRLAPRSLGRDDKKRRRENRQSRKRERARGRKPAFTQGVELISQKMRLATLSQHPANGPNRCHLSFMPARRFLARVS